jgi:hypothetical protein
VTAALDAVEKRANEISGGSVWWRTPPSINTLRAVGDALDDLATAVDGADAAPSPDAAAGFEEIQPALTATLDAWDELKAKDLVVLNDHLKKTGRPEIALKP